MKGNYMEDKELEELIQSQTKELADKQFMNGVLAGWNACLFNIRKEIFPLNSSKKIKKLIDKKINESKDRIEKNIKEEKVEVETIEN